MTHAARGFRPDQPYQSPQAMKLELAAVLVRPPAQAAYVRYDDCLRCRSIRERHRQGSYGPLHHALPCLHVPTPPEPQLAGHGMVPLGVRNVWDLVVKIQRLVPIPAIARVSLCRGGERTFLAVLFPHADARCCARSCLRRLPSRILAAFRMAGPAEGFGQPKRSNHSNSECHADVHLCVLRRNIALALVPGANLAATSVFRSRFLGHSPGCTVRALRYAALAIQADLDSLRRLGFCPCPRRVIGGRTANVGFWSLSDESTPGTKR
jgi:hypothetical protein